MTLVAYCINICHVTLQTGPSVSEFTCSQPTNPTGALLPVQGLLVPRLSDAYLRHQLNLSSVLPSLQVH